MTTPTSPLPTIAVIGRFVTLANRPAHGYVTLTPIAEVAGAGWTVVGATVQALVRDGQLATTIIADSAELSPDLYVRVAEFIDGAPAQTYIVQPQGTLLDLATAPRTGEPPPGPLYVPSTALGQPNGVATLGPDGILTASQRPASSGGGVTDHGALTGLADDDHPQYLTAARGDSRYYVQSWVDTSLNGKENVGTASTLLGAHTSAPDPHPQYTTSSELSTALTPYATQSALTSGLAGKENTGVAAGLLSAHTAATDPHPQYTTAAELSTALGPYATTSALTSGLAGKENTGVAASLLTAHTAATDPHPQYATDSDLAGKANLSHTHTAAQVTDFTTAVDARVTPYVGAPPTSLNSLEKLADALGDDPAYATSTATALAGKQPLDADLTTFAGLAPADDTLLQRVSGNWDARTPAQVKTTLALTKSDVGLGNVSDLAPADLPVSTATQAALDTKIGLSVIDAAGDLLVGTADNAVNRLAKGSNGQLLGVSGGNVGWINAPSGGDRELYEPATAGLLDWTTDPKDCEADFPHNNGVLLMVRFRYRGSAAQLSEIGFAVTSGASGPGAYSGVALYEDGAGVVNRLAQSADAGTQWTSQGVKSVAFTAPANVTSGAYYRAAILWQGSSAGRIAGCAATILDALLNAGIRRSTYLTGQTGFPATVTVSSMNTNNALYWLGMK